MPHIATTPAPLAPCCRRASAHATSHAQQRRQRHRSMRSSSQQTARLAWRALLGAQQAAGAWAPWPGGVAGPQQRATIWPACTAALGLHSWTAQHWPSQLQDVAAQPCTRREGRAGSGAAAAGTWGARRSYSQQQEGDLRVVHADISEHDYHRLADALLDQLQEKLEVFVEDLDLEGGDVEHAQGVLTVKLGRHGTYVINKQTPNRQIWLSSPLTGPFRYDWQHGAWRYSRDGRELLPQLQDELRQLLGSAPQLVGGS